MKIIKKTPNQLILQHRPIGIWLMGSILTIVGLVIIILFTRASSLTCQRISPNQGSCELTRSHFLMSKTIIVSINDLKGAEVVMNHARQMDSFFILKPYYRVILVIPTKRIPLTAYGTTTRDQQEAIANKINTFIKNQAKTSLFIERDQRWLIYLVGSIFIVVGLLAELSKIITVTFDKILGTLTIEREGLLRTDVFEFPMEDIIKVKLKNASLFNSEKEGNRYQVALELKSDKELPLTKTSTLKAKKEEIVKEITNFLCQPHFTTS